MSREDLMKMKVDELRKYASSVGVKNSHGFKKADLVEAILAAEKSAQSSNEKDAEVEQKIDSQKEDSAEEAVAGENENDAADVVNVSMDMERKMPYIEAAAIGTIVAFKVPNTGVLKSAKIVNRSTKNRKLKLETAYKKQYVVRYEDIVWVRAGSRWPTGVLKALKEGARYVEEDK